MSVYKLQLHRKKSFSKSCHLLVNKPLAFYVTWIFINTFIKAYQWTPFLSQMNPVHTQNYISLRPILTLSSHLHLDFPYAPFPSGVPPEILYQYFNSHMHSTFCTHLILLDLITLVIFGTQYKLWSSFLGLCGRNFISNFCLS